MNITQRPNKEQYWQHGDFVATDDLEEVYLIVYDYTDNFLYLVPVEGGSFEREEGYRTMEELRSNNPRLEPLRHAELIIGN